MHVEGLKIYNDHIENLRKSEFPLLRDQTYLDHAGTTLYAKSLVERFASDLNSTIYGNPHSSSNPSAVSGACVDKIRDRTLRFFNADPNHFDLVFVANATAAIKLVAEAFRDAPSSLSSSSESTGFWYGWHRDAHSSLVGVREVTKGSHQCFHSDEDVQRWIDGGCNGHRGSLGLFAYPGQSNMTGRRLPLAWPGQIRETQTANDDMQKIYTLLDAAALCTTRPLDFGDPLLAPDFTALSFYKIFGFPDLGALIVRKAAGPLLQQRRYFGGGTVDMVISLADTWHARKTASIHDSVEDGTLPFHAILALGHALDVHARLYGSMQLVSAHTAHLIRTLHDALRALRHARSGRPAIQVYNDPGARFGDPATQGATIAFNVRRDDDDDGGDGAGFVGYEDVQNAANRRRIYVRSGSLCNPGGMAHFLDWSPPEMRAAYANGHRCSDPVQLVQGKPTGVVRVSLGAMSTMRDVERWVQFVREEYVDQVGVAMVEKGEKGGKVMEVVEQGPDLLYRETEDAMAKPALAAPVIKSRRVKLPIVGLLEMEKLRGVKVKWWKNYICLSKATRPGDLSLK